MYSIGAQASEDQLVFFVADEDGERLFETAESDTPLLQTISDGTPMQRCRQFCQKLGKKFTESRELIEQQRRLHRQGPGFQS